MLSEYQKKKFRNLQPELGISVPTVQKYNRNNKYPEDIAIKAEILTGGKLLASVMCPDTIGSPTPTYSKFAAEVFKSFDLANPDLFIVVLNFLEKQQPELYESMITRLEDVLGGHEFLQARNAHRGS